MLEPLSRGPQRAAADSRTQGSEPVQSERGTLCAEEQLSSTDNAGLLGVAGGAVVS